MANTSTSSTARKTGESPADRFYRDAEPQPHHVAAFDGDGPTGDSYTQSLRALAQHLDENSRPGDVEASALAAEMEALARRVAAWEAPLVMGAPVEGDVARRVA